MTTARYSCIIPPDVHQQARIAEVEKAAAYIDELRFCQFSKKKVSGGIQCHLDIYGEEPLSIVHEVALKATGETFTISHAT
jgi:hypothetical protein